MKCWTSLSIWGKNLTSRFISNEFIKRVDGLRNEVPKFNDRVNRATLQENINLLRQMFSLKSKVMIFQDVSVTASVESAQALSSNIHFQSLFLLGSGLGLLCLLAVTVGRTCCRISNFPFWKKTPSSKEIAAVTTNNDTNAILSIAYNRT